MSARAPFNATARPAATTLTPQRSPWHSPVPYLFGGLAAMLGLIAFALLILACSYWKLSGYLDGGDGAGDRDLESGDGKGDDDSAKKGPPAFEEKILVIMAGQAKPTFLATPASSRTSSFGDNSSSSSSSGGGSSNDGSCLCQKSTEKSSEMAETDKAAEVSGDCREAERENYR